MHAGLLLLAGRSESYRQACADMIRQFGESEKLWDRGYVARACALAPNAVADAMLPVTLAERNVGDHLGFWDPHTLGMAHLRARQFDEAQRRLRESTAIAPGYSAAYLNWLGLALVEYQHGDEPIAQEWFAKAVEWMDQHEETNLGHWVEGELLRREAKELSKTRKQAPDETRCENGNARQAYHPARRFFVERAL